MSTHRYYAHSKVRDEKAPCKIGRIKAEEIEEVVVSRLGQIATDGDYFKNLQLLVRKNGPGQKEQLRKELNQVVISIGMIKLEIDQVFKLQLQLEINSSAFELSKERLESLGKQKKVMEELRTKLEDQISYEISPEDSLECLKSNMLEFRRGWKKGTPSEQKRLLRSLIGKLVCKENGIDVHYYDAAFDAEDTDQNSRKKLKKNKDLGLDLPIVVSGTGVTKLSSQNLRDDVNGDSGTTRTYDPLLRREMLYPAELRNHLRSNIAEGAQTSKLIPNFQAHALTF